MLKVIGVLATAVVEFGREQAILDYGEAIGEDEAGERNALRRLKMLGYFDDERSAGHA
jgi:hypothetical protein